MGTFATTTSLQTLLPGVTFDSVTTALCSSCIVWGENYVRGTLAKRYDFSASPFNTTTSIPPQITSITEKLAMGYYFKNASRGAKESISRGEALLKDAKEELQMILDHKTVLLDSTYSPVSEGLTTIICSTSSYQPTFDEDDPLSWAVDSNKLDDISSARDAAS